MDCKNFGGMQLVRLENGHGIGKEQMGGTFWLFWLQGFCLCRW